MRRSIDGEPRATDDAARVTRLSVDEVDRLRIAYERRASHQASFTKNPGQTAIVDERDRVIAELIGSHDRPVDKLIDVGCGLGAVLATLVGSGVVRHGVGVDVLPERVAQARRLHPDLDLRVASGLELPFGDEEFDVALAMTVFSSIPRHHRAAVVEEIVRVLKHGGALIWYDLRRPSPMNPNVHPFAARDVRRYLPTWEVSARTLTLAPPIARRLGRFTSRLYPVLSSVGFLRTHEAGSATRP